TVARTRGEIDLPAPSVDELERVLRRFGSADPATLATVYRRCAQIGGDCDESIQERVEATSLAVDAAAPVVTGRRPDRRVARVNVTELRRALRQAEREIFELRARTGIKRRFVASAAAVLLVSVGGLLHYAGGDDP